MFGKALFTVGLMTLVELSFGPGITLQVNLWAEGGEDVLANAFS
jgi:hypothetical protein